MSRPDYKYEPLPSAETHIRLLHILPRANNGLISLALKTVSLDNAKGTYDAISYTWGSFLPVYKVLVDGRCFWIRENIFQFLRQSTSTLLGENLNANLWIDSICINQQDVTEKNAQVQGMAAIFSQARRVVVWLGQASRRSIWAQLTMGRYPRMADFLKEAHARREHSEPDDIALRADIRQLALSPYWTRLWIVQELALAQQAVVVSGSELCDLSVFLSASTLAGYFFYVHDSASGEDVEWRAAAKQADQLAQRHLYKETQSSYHGLAPLVETFASQQCFDPHDHVYGLVGLAEGGETLTVDYGIDMELLLWQVLEVTHQQLSTMSAGARRDSYQWNLEKLLGVFNLRVEDMFNHSALQQRIVDDRFAVEMKNNGLVKSPVPHDSVSVASGSHHLAVFSLIVTWYYYGDLSILLSSDFSHATLAYVSDPENQAYAGDIYNRAVEMREISMSEAMQHDLFESMRKQDMTHQVLTTTAEAGESLSVGFSFRSLVELSRLSAIGNEYMQPETRKDGTYVGGARKWPNGFPWADIMHRVEVARATIPT